MKKMFLISSVLLVSLLLSTFTYSDEQSEKAKTDSSPIWSYSGKTGPEHWGDLNKDYVLAKEGKEQSPIDIQINKVATSTSASGVQINYVPTTFKVENNGHGVEGVTEAKDSYVVVDGKKYYLAQFHFHAPSEHTLNGKYSEMAVHFVHISEDGQIAVIGVLIDKGAENKTLKEFFSKMPKQKTKDKSAVLLNSKIDIVALLPKNSQVFRYEGSLTTPPATEGVYWIVFKKTIELSNQQISNFKSIYPNNSRPIQPLNGRKVILY